MSSLVAPVLGVTVIGPDAEVADQFAENVPPAINALSAGRLDQVIVFEDRTDVPDLIARRIPTSGPTVTSPTDSAEVTAVILTVRTDVDRITVTDYISRQAGSVGITLAIACVTALLILRFGLRPLAQMADAADSIASGARRERLPTYGRHHETDRLAVAVNNAFDAQLHAEENIRNFAADTSHELRIPLATVSGWLDLYHQGALDDPARLQRALERVAGEVGRMRACWSRNSPCWPTWTPAVPWRATRSTCAGSRRTSSGTPRS